MRVGLIAIASLTLTASFAGAQSKPEGAATSGKHAATARSAVPKTPWGVPDLQGVWTGSTLTPLERPDRFAGKQFLTDAEAAALEKEAANAGERPDVPGDPGTYNQIWFDPGTKVVPDKRTSLIVDPPDGRIPFTPEGRRHTTVSARRYGRGPFDSYLDLDTGERCFTDGVIIWFSGYNNNYQIIQTADHIVILHELFRETRIIPLDGRPHGRIPQWLGDSRGRWEGSTLVVETTNFADKSAYWWNIAWRASRPTLRVVERFTRVDAETIEYQFTMEDPSMFIRPWTAAYPLTTNQASRGVTAGKLYEYACHEGNRALPNVLAGARAQDSSSQKR